MLLNIQSGAQTISFSIICHQTETNKSSIINQSDYKFSKFKFYLSNIRLYNDNNIIDQEIYSYHLIDLLDTSKDKLIIKRNNNLTYNKIEFDLIKEIYNRLKNAILFPYRKTPKKLI